MQRLLLTLAIIAASTSSIAANSWNYMMCNGSDSAGRAVSLSAYSDANYVTINGDNLRIVGPTRDNSGVVTENFVSVAGTLVYDSIVPTSNVTLNIYQFNAVTQALLAKASLGCNFYGYRGAATKVIDQPLFKSLKK